MQDGFRKTSKEQFSAEQVDGYSNGGWQVEIKLYLQHYNIL